MDGKISTDQDYRRRGSKRPLRLLVVDDSPEDLEMMRKTLAHATRRYDAVIERPDCRGLVDELHANPYDIVILNYRFRVGPSGINLRSQIKTDVPHPPIVVLCSGVADTELETLAKALGASEYADKEGFSVSLIRNAVQDVFQHARGAPDGPASA